jgi:hypothetical protein
MATVAAGQKFLGVASTVETTDKKSAKHNALTEYYPIEDIQDLTAVDVTAKSLALADLGTAPASKTATGTKGQIVVVDGYIYVCVDTDSWKRVEIADW